MTTKCAERAEAKAKNLCNNSVSKMQFSFGRDKRFKQRRELMTQYHFYDVPSQVSKRMASFGCSKRETFGRMNQNPPPTQYNPNKELSKFVVNFAAGREQCKINSIFYNTTISYPGPASYNPEVPKESKNISLKGKIQTSYQTISPGPKYHFQSGLLEKAKLLSTEKKRGAIKMVLPINSKRRVKTQYSINDVSSNYRTEGYITRKGDRKLGEDAAYAYIPLKKRFAQKNPHCQNPGPGFYQTFSDFIDGEKI